MKSFFYNHIDLVITIIGFIVTYFLTKKNILAELTKIKRNSMVENLQDVPMSICNFLDFLLYKQNEKDFQRKLQDKFLPIMNKILSYGSSDAIKILSHIQQIGFHPEKVADKSIVVNYYALLISQIKYDISSEIILPNTWLKMKLTDYSSQEQKINSQINEIVLKLNLNKKFLCNKSSLKEEKKAQLNDTKLEESRNAVSGEKDNMESMILINYFFKKKYVKRIVAIVTVVSPFLVFTYIRGQLSSFTINYSTLDFNVINSIYSVVHFFLGSLLVVGAYYHIIFVLQKDNRYFSKFSIMDLCIEMLLIVFGLYFYFEIPFKEALSNIKIFLLPLLILMVVFYGLAFAANLISEKSSSKISSKLSSKKTMINLFILMVVIPIATLYGITYSSGVEKTEKKTEYKTLLYMDNNYVVIFETESDYLITPCDLIENSDDTNKKTEFNFTDRTQVFPINKSGVIVNNAHYTNPRAQK